MVPAVLLVHLYPPWAVISGVWLHEVDQAGSRWTRSGPGVPAGPWCWVVASAKTGLTSCGKNSRPDGYHPPNASHAPWLSGGHFFSSHTPNKGPHPLVAPGDLWCNQIHQGHPADKLCPRSTGRDLMNYHSGRAAWATSIFSPDIFYSHLHPQLCS